MAVDDEDTEQAARAFRTRSPIAIAMLANVVLAALCLGVPYVRGHAQAKQSLRAFSRFAACVFGGQQQTSLGLGLPSGERSHFAGQVMRAGASWPDSCKPALHAIAPEEAIFLWPSVKQAGADVRTVVRLVDSELSQLARLRQMEPAGRVPERPLLAVSKLRAVLSLLAKAASADTDLDANAVAFKTPSAVADPARLPIVAGSGATLQAWAGQDGLYALAMDGRGVSWLRVEGGKVDHRRWKRTSLVRAALRAGAQPLIVWAMSPQKCEDDEQHCVHRATGVARFAADAEALPTPSWLGGHPAGRVDRSLRLTVDGHVDLLARADAEGRLELRRFKLEPGERADAPPSSPIERFALPGTEVPEDALLLPGQPAAVAFATSSEAGVRVWLWRYESNEAPFELGSVAGSGAWLAACELDSARAIAFGSGSELGLAKLAAEGPPSALLAPTAIGLGAPLHPEDPNHDRVRLLCHGDRVTLVGANQQRALLALSCGAASCERGPELASGVSSFDAVALGDGALVAYSRSAQPQLTLQALDTHAAPRGPAQTPAACWDPSSGMCGQPTLVADAGRLLLCARDGSDLLAIESDDAGQHWKPMSGLKVSTAIDTDVSAPMQQHRVRKGLD
jgi:hypothetical protein